MKYAINTVYYYIFKNFDLRNGMIKCSSDFALCIMNAKFLNGHKDM